MIQVKIKCADQSGVGDDTFEILTRFAQNKPPEIWQV
jgi:hypothetical protein